MATRDAFVYGSGSHTGDAGLGDRVSTTATSPLLGRFATHFIHLMLILLLLFYVCILPRS